MSQTTRTFLFTGLVVVMLLAMHLLPQLTVGGVGLRHVNILSSVFPEPAMPEVAYEVAEVPPPPPVVAADTTDTATLRKPKPLPEGVTPIVDYSAGAPGGMAHFYAQLSNVASLGRPVRIAYYGDSFIEGDILTCDLREMLQAKYGGYGVGWVDCDSKVAAFRPTVKQSSEGLTEHEVMAKPFDRSRQGISQRYFVAKPEARVTATATRYKPHLSRWSVARLFMRADGPIAVRAFADGRLADSTVVAASPSLQMVEVSDTMRSITFEIDGATEGSTLYGMSLEGRSGVVLDNLSMRGSSGYSIAEMPSSMLADFARVRPYDLIVLHFGINIIGDESGMANYKAFAQRMARSIAKLRAAFPEASILVVSVPDRDQRTDQGIVTMDGIEPLVAQQQIMAANSGVAFFNLYKAMGGRESMASMVDKGWATKDYTHLSFAGGRYVARLLYESLMAGMGGE